VLAVVAVVFATLQREVREGLAVVAMDRQLTPAQAQPAALTLAAAVVAVRRVMATAALAVPV
jgi:hypothetical protein